MIRRELVMNKRAIKITIKVLGVILGFFAITIAMYFFYRGLAIEEVKYAGVDVSSELAVEIMLPYIKQAVTAYVVCWLLSYILGGGVIGSLKKFWNIAKMGASWGSGAVGCMGFLMGIPFIGLLIGYIVVPIIVMYFWLIVFLLMPWLIILVGNDWRHIQ